MSWWNDFLNYYIRPSTNFLTMGLSELGWKDWEERNNSGEAQSLLDQGKTPLDVQGIMASQGKGMSPDMVQYLNNLISGQRTEEAQEFSKYQSQNDILNAAKQLEQIGLSASGVLQTGGSQMNAVDAANTNMANPAMQRYSQRMALAKQLLGMTSQMASAGIYGSAIGAARKASSIMTSAASHSALAVQNAINDNAWDQLVKQDPKFAYYMDHDVDE